MKYTILYLFTVLFAFPLLGSDATFPEISIDELESAVKAKTVFVIDANSADTYKSGHIPTAISFAKHKKDLEKQLPSDKSKMIVAYCGGPQCSAWEAAAEKAKELGYTNIKHFKGGIKTWKEKQKPTEKG